MPRSAAAKSRSQQRKQRQQPPTMTPEPLIQPVKAQKRWPWLIALIAGGILVGFGIWHAVSGSSSSAHTSASPSTVTASTPLPSATPTHTWHTFLTFTGGNGTKNTQKFKVPADWQFSWSCRGVNGIDGALYIAIYNANGSLYNAGAQVTCLASRQATGSVEEHQSGNVYLNINSNDPWTVTVQKP